MARKTRSSPDDLAAALAKPSFTPGRGDVPGLIELVVAGAEPAATRAARALAGLGAAHVAAVVAAQAGAEEGARARLVGALGQLARAGATDAVTTIVAATRDDSTRVRRAAANALGKLGGDVARAALIARWDATDVAPDERRALAEALGKVGGDAALSRLRAAASGDDTELARRRDRALLMADRTARRDEDSQIATDVAPPSPLVVRLATRGGIAPLLVEELAQLRIAGVALSDRVVQIELAAPWSTLFASRLWVAGAIRVPFEAPAVAGRARRDDRVADPDALAAAIVRAIAAPATQALLRSWTRGPIRWRLGFAHGHKRSIVWRVARDVTAAAPALVNDPTATTWDFVVDDQAGTLEVVPRRADDPRFAWRVADVPASSHPTVAAALAWVAGARDTDRVWDPFCGAGAELVERALRGPYRTLLGTDLDPVALDAARANVAASSGSLDLALADARTHDPGTVDLVITNPPLGSRVQLDAAALCCDALPNFARHLAPGGRLVWISPSTRRTSPVAEGLGLVRTRSLAVDLGGVRGQLERWERR